MKLTQANARREVLRLFEVYAARGPVNTVGARNAIDKVWPKLSPYLHAENRARLVAERAKALAGDRAPFDATIARLRVEFRQYAGEGAAP
jgi:hypothetical protein